MTLFDGRVFREQAAEDAQPQGAYVALLVSPQSARDVHGWARLMGLTDLVPPDALHATLMYSREMGLDESMHGDSPLPAPITVDRHNLPRVNVLGRPGDAGALVQEYDCDRLQAAHRELRDRYGLEHSFPEYRPHVTLSYDASSVPRHVLARLIRSPYPGPLVFDRRRVAFCNQ